ncbi:MAG: SpoIID/LytB domain-containing protein [Bacteroidales bacterium]|nr:SpoIID/LytB domain-containing protein [Bacteroidales bacterium]
MEMVKNTEPIISVGIMKSEKVRFALNGRFSLDGREVTGEHEAVIDCGHVMWEGERRRELTFEPLTEDATFTLHDVVIGVNFHWQRNEEQTFSGSLSIVVDGDKIWAVNRLPIEDYLYCVIASEMSATSGLELLKAHAIVSRSWLVAQLQRKNSESRIEYRTPGELVKWYDRDDHHLFDVCADDHCQRYQGLTRLMTVKQGEGGKEKNSYTDVLKRAYENTIQKIHVLANNGEGERGKTAVRRAIDETRGMMLVSDGEICDARFSKCCGGVTETYDTCWDATEHRYLQSFVDYTHKPSGYKIDLRVEGDARRWIETSPDAFCNTQDAKVLRQVLNSYDQETSDFYRWTVKYTTAELSDLVRRRSGVDFGEIKELIPLTRGMSGRIMRLEIVGSKMRMVIGKELEIRRTLSESHLYSSAFTVEKTQDGFVLRGAGWGHGVGMCQIGAAVMDERGFSYKGILLHYFRCAMVEKWWK